MIMANYFDTCRNRVLNRNLTHGAFRIAILLFACRRVNDNTLSVYELVIACYC